MNSFMENLSATFASLEKDREFVGTGEIDKFGGHLDKQDHLWGKGDPGKMVSPLLP